MDFFRELPFGVRQYCPADNISPRSILPNSFRSVGRNGFLPLQRSALFDAAKCGFYPNESGTVEVFYTFTS